MRDSTSAPTEQNNGHQRSIVCSAGDSARLRRATWRFDQFALVAFFVLLFWSPVRSDDELGPTTVVVIWGIAYALAVVGLIVQRRQAAQLFMSAIPILSVVGLALCSAAWSDYQDLTFKRACILGATTASAYLITCRFKLPAFLEGLALATGVAAVISFFDVFVMPLKGIMHEEYAGAWRGMFGDKNALGEAMALGAATQLALAFARGTSVRRRMLLLALTGLCCFMLIGSQSVTSIAMFGIMAGTLLLFALLRLPLRTRLTVTVAVVVAAGSLVWFRSSQLLDAFGRDATLTGRTDIWYLVTECIWQRPWFGYGYNAFWLPEGGSSYLPSGLQFEPYHAHNGLLQLALDIGCVGVTLFVIALVIALWQAGRLAIRRRGIVCVWPLAAMLYVIAGSITEANIAQYYSRMNWVIFVVAALYASDVSLRYIAIEQEGDNLVVPDIAASMNRVPPYIAP